MVRYLRALARSVGLRYFVPLKARLRLGYAVECLNSKKALEGESSCTPMVACVPRSRFGGQNTLQFDWETLRSRRKKEVAYLPQKKKSVELRTDGGEGVRSFFSARCLSTAASKAAGSRAL